MATQTITNFDAVLRRIDSQAVLDGAVDDRLFSAAQPKILWILREPVGPGPWDLREFLKNDDSLFTYSRAGATFATVAKVSHGLLRGRIDWDSWAEDWRLLTASLREIAVINVSKRGAEPRTRWKRLAASAHDFSDAVAAQIRALGPDIVIAAGTYELLPPGPRSGLRELHMFCGRTVSDTRWIRTYHPAQTRITAKEFYTRICRALEP